MGKKDKKKNKNPEKKALKQEKVCLISPSGIMNVYLLLIRYLYYEFSYQLNLCSSS